MEFIRAVDTVVATLDRISRNFEEGVRTQADLTRGDIGIVSNRENIDTWERGAAAKFFRRSTLAQEAYQVDSAIQSRIKLGLEHAMAGRGSGVDRPQTLCSEQLEQCRLLAEEGAGLRQATRVLGCSRATMKKALALEASRWADGLSPLQRNGRNRHQRPSDGHHPRLSKKTPVR